MPIQERRGGRASPGLRRFARRASTGPASALLAVLNFMWSLDLRPHGLDPRRWTVRLRGWCGGSLVIDGARDGISGPAGRHIGIDVAGLQRLKIGLRAIAGIRR